VAWPGLKRMEGPAGCGCGLGAGVWCQEYLLKAA
jgi:hypothetical protein